MKVIVAVEELKKKLDQVRAVVDAKSTIPVLSFVRVQVKGGQMALTGKDLIASLETRLSAKFAGDGAFLLPAAPLAQVLSLLATPEITLETVDSETGPHAQVMLDAGKEYNATFKTPQANTFPETDALPGGPGFTFGLPMLQQLIGRVIFCVPDADGKSNISVGLLESTNEIVRAVGTDGFKLAIAEVAGQVGKFQFNLPKTAMSLIRGLSGEAVSVLESETAFFFKTTAETLIVRKVHGQFPPYQRILPAEFKTEITLSSKELQDSLQKAAIVANPEEPRVVFKTGDELVGLAAASDEVGSGYASVPAKYTGEPVEVVLNADYLFSFLTEAASIEAPLAIRVLAANRIMDFRVGDSYRFLVMPIAKQP